MEVCGPFSLSHEGGGGWRSPNGRSKSCQHHRFGDVSDGASQYIREDLALEFSLSDEYNEKITLSVGDSAAMVEAMYRNGERQVKTDRAQELYDWAADLCASSLQTVTTVGKSLALFTAKIPGIYFLLVGKLGDVTTSMGLANKEPDNWLVVKAGKAVDLHDRLPDHRLILLFKTHGINGNKAV
ncbi:hypothetical protein HDU86_004806 [Geranomyces michiganensis]|nr:hypothetical protein HDU86_004806 [Geranomyces michiganensis]